MSDGEEKQYRVIAALPPGAAVHLAEGSSTSSIPLWLYWVRIARLQARYAAEAAEPDEVIDSLSASVHGLDRPRLHGDREPPEWSELFAALVTVAAAAHALDGFYGSVKPLVDPPASDAKRSVHDLRRLGLAGGLSRNRSAGAVSPWDL